jgi:hypothetical protein
MAVGYEYTLEVALAFSENPGSADAELPIGLPSTRMAGKAA